MTTMTAPDIAGQLEQAQREATRLRTDFDRAEGELAQAIEAKDYGTAAELKQRAAELRPHVLLAEANVEAFHKTAEALREHARQENAAQVEKERQERAQAIQVEAMAAEQKALAAAQRFLEEAQAAVATVANALRAGLAAETTAGRHRQTAYQAGVDAGWQEPSIYGAGAPNHVGAAIDLSPMFTEILRGTA
jgi:hypothetical protein